MGTEAGAAQVRDAAGATWPLGDWLADLLMRSKQSVTRTVDRAHLSRSFYYLVRDGKQVPSVESLASLLEALDVDEVRLAAPTEPGDLYCVVDGRAHTITLPRSGRRAVRSRTALYSLANGPRELAPVADYQVNAAGIVPARSPDDRTRLIAELLHHASDLDVGRLRLLAAHAELLARE